jgi:endonuclease/exonuclease/phosphatase family metal-dependent hydrolase
MARQAADTRQVQFRALTWNLFHGRDAPPDPSLFTWRSRLFRITERNASHVQVNRDLRPEFSRLLAAAQWDVALLQECPPRFAEALASACRAERHRVLTSRNSLGPLRSALARLNPDLVASAEGGSNLTLVRRDSPLGRIVERRERAIREGRPERRAMAFTRTESGLCIANIHTTNDRPDLAREELLLAARTAEAWADGSALLLGGDLNISPGGHPKVFDTLRDRFGLAAPTVPNSIDHLLVRDVEVVDPPDPWPPEAREASEDGRALRLSDHAPVSATFVL